MPLPSRRDKKASSSSSREPVFWLALVAIVLLSNMLVYQVTMDLQDDEDRPARRRKGRGPHRQQRDGRHPRRYDTNEEETLHEDAAKYDSNTDHNYNPLEIPRGIAQALPSIRISESSQVKRSIYGGAGDRPHLGGFTDIDVQGLSPRAWKWMVQRLNIRSVLDVGCGRGISTTWFLFHGLNETLCVEGSHDARDKTLLPDPDTQMVEHDFARGPWWPTRTFDAVWCVEFLEHVGRNFHKNYLPAFRKAGFIFVTHSINGGWHHVEVHRDDWWKTKLELYGFRFLPDLTQELRTLVWNETHDPTKGVAPNGHPIGAPHIHANMLIFFNPAVTALDRHAHLVYEPGCFQSRGHGQLILRDCGQGKDGSLETPLPPEFKPLTLTPAQDQQWFEWVQARVKPWIPPNDNTNTP